MELDLQHQFKTVERPCSWSAATKALTCVSATAESPSVLLSPVRTLNHHPYATSLFSLLLVHVIGSGRAPASLFRARVQKARVMATTPSVL